MGRRCTGVSTIESSLKISIKDLKLKGLLAKDKCIISTLSWSLKTDKIASVQYFKTIDIEAIHLSYKTKGKEYNCKIDLIEIGSNLGVGMVLFFLCPKSGSKCKTLFFNNKSNMWESREAFTGGIYYESQLTSKLGKYDRRYWATLHSIENLTKTRRSEYYKKEETHRHKRITTLNNKLTQLDYDRWLNSGLQLFNFPILQRRD